MRGDLGVFGDLLIEGPILALISGNPAAFLVRVAVRRPVEMLCSSMSLSNDILVLAMSLCSEADIAVGAEASLDSVMMTGSMFASSKEGGGSRRIDLFVLRVVCDPTLGNALAG